MSLVSDIPRLILEQGNIQAEGQRRHGAIVGGTLASIGQTVATIPYQIQRQKELAQEQQVRGLHLQSLQGDLADKEKARARQAKIEQILSQYPDIEQAIPEVMKVDPAAGSVLSKHVNDARKEGFDEYERQQKFVTSQLQQVHDQGTLTSKLYTLKHAFPNQDWSDIPEDYDSAKPVITERIMSSLSPEKRAELDLKTRDTAARELRAKNTGQKADTLSNETELYTAAANPNHPLNQVAIDALALKAKTPSERRQAEWGLLKGKPAAIAFDPATGKRYDAEGNDVTATVKPIPPASVMYPQAASTRLIKVEHKDPATGRTVIEWLPQNELKGQTFEKGNSAAVDARLASAEAVNQTGNDIIAQLKDPAVASKLGPAMGRFNTLRDFIGNPPPELSDLAGAIESYALANMGVHGMRSVQGAEKIKDMLDQKQTPESLIGKITGLNRFSTHFMENEGRPAAGKAKQKVTRNSKGELIFENKPK